MPAGLLFSECPQPLSNRLSPWRASCFGVRRVLRAHVSLRATGGHDRHRDWSHPVVQLCVEKIPLTIRLSSRGQKYIFFTARIISSPWRVFPAGRTRHDSCSLGPAAGGGVISPPLAEDGSIVSEPRRGEVWMVVLGMAASSALLGNQHAPGRSCWCDSRPLGSVRGCVGIHKSIAENAISCDDFHFSPMGKSNSTAGVRKSRAAKVISGAGFRKSSAGEHFSTIEFDNSRAGEAISLAGFHKSSEGKTISATGSRKSYAGEAISSTEFG